jgi:hypothetical protein
MMTKSPPLHTLEISARPSISWSQIFLATLFSVVFNFGSMMIVLLQFTCLVPLRLIPLASVRRVYDAGMRDSKGAFAAMLSECFYTHPRSPAVINVLQCGGLVF